MHPEPPMIGSELDTLIGSLERQRATFRWKASGVDSAGRSLTIGAASLTIGGLIKHLAYSEASTFLGKFLDQPLGEPWQSVDWKADGNWEFTTGATDDEADLWALWESAVERSRRIVGEAPQGLDTLTIKNWDGEHASLRRLMVDMIEEYARHVGHLDLIREAVDGLVGEDPPESWNGNF